MALFSTASRIWRTECLRELFVAVEQDGHCLGVTKSMAIVALIREYRPEDGLLLHFHATFVNNSFDLFIV